MIEIQIEKNWQEDEKLTDFIMNISDNGTVFHRPLFLQYHGQEKFQNIQPVKIIFREEEKMLACISGAVEFCDERKSFISPFGSSYGGLVYHSDLTFKEIEEIYFLLLEHLQKEYDHFKLSSSPFFQSRTGKALYVDHILLSKGFTITKSDIVLVHPLDHAEKLPARIDKKLFAQLKQPLYKKKLRIERISGPDPEAFELLLASQARFQAKPTHSFEELMKIEELVPGTVQTFKSYLGEKLVSGIITFHVNKDILLNFYVFDSLEGRELKANHFTYYNVAVYAHEQDYKYLDFGPSSFGWNPNYPLIYFKERFDGRPFLRNIFEKQAV